MKTPTPPPTPPPAYGAALRHARRLLCTRLAHAADEPDATFARGYIELAAEVEAHLRHEELAMEACGDNAVAERLHEQRAENAAIVAALQHTMTQVEDGEFEQARQLMAALTDILSLHRISTDLALPRRQRPPGRLARMHGRAARAPPPAPRSRRPSFR